MRCPFCGFEETQVKDSRSTEEGASIRRRRQCPSCGARFTSFERIQLREMTVRKSDNRTEVFDRDKLQHSMTLAMRKRPVTEEQIERATSSIVRQLELLGENEITSEQIGTRAMNALYTLDKVGYIRYASVYRDFRDMADFTGFIRDLSKRMKAEQPAGRATGKNKAKTTDEELPNP
ncbi:MAG TPA: transcriptional regulator NrdR [Cellvibrio sp.]